MSSVKGTSIIGDVSIGRNLAIGGRTVIQGDVTAKGRLRVDGWLIADNVKVSNKGLFTTIEELASRYPTPQDGWWALVGESLPADIYVARDGEWEATGGQGGSETLDIARYDSLIEELQSDIFNASQEIANLQEKEETQDEAFSNLSNSVTEQLVNLTTEIGGLSLTHNTDKAASTEAITALETKVSNINKALSNKNTELEKCIGVLAFDGYVDTQEDAEGEDIGTVWYSTGQSCFVVVEDTGISNFCVHNDSAKDWSQPRMDCLFSSTGQLLVFDGEDLVNWEPELLRDDVTDLGDALSEVTTRVDSIESVVEDLEGRMGEVESNVEAHITDVSIYAFNGDGPPSTSSSAYNGPAGIYYSQSEGLFYKTTSGSPSLSVPHNTNGKARTDCLYRKGNVLYRYDGTSLSEYVSPSVAAELAELRSLIANL